MDGPSHKVFSNKKEFLKCVLIQLFVVNDFMSFSWDVLVMSDVGDVKKVKFETS